jgi:hypothetical protein
MVENKRGERALMLEKRINLVWKIEGKAVKILLIACGNC